MARITTTRVVPLAVLCAALFAPPLANADEHRFELGAFVGYHIFSDTNELGAFDEEPVVTLDDSLILGARAGYAVIPRLIIEGELGVLPSETDNAATDVLAVVWRAQALYDLLDPKGDTRPFVLAGIGAMTGRPEDQTVNLDDTDLVLHAGVGVKRHLSQGWGLRGDLRIALPPSTGSEFVTIEPEFLLGVYKEFGRHEKIAVKDSDGDGIFDPEDGCVLEAEDEDGFEDLDGCPELDNDKDSIPDSADSCPNEPEDVDQYEDEDGCPDDDNDRDGFPDEQDACRDDAEDVDQFEDDDGCPEADNDQDGILDGEDKCPLEAETINEYQDQDGCPDEVPVEVKKFTGTIKGIAFRSNSDAIRSSSFAVLDEAVAVLKSYPDVRLEIQGHTDDVGKDDYNLALSEKRANSVKAYFVSKGIAEERLVTKGFGESQPEVSGKSKDARARNRRVVFLLIR